MKFGPQPLAEIRSLAAASSWYNGTPGRIFEIAVSLDALVVSYTSLLSVADSLKIEGTGHVRAVAVFDAAYVKENAVTRFYNGIVWRMMWVSGICAKGN